MQSLLATADTNKDGFVDKDELTKLAQQQAGRRKGGGPGMGRDGWNADEITSRVLGDRPRFCRVILGERGDWGVFGRATLLRSRIPAKFLNSFSQPSSPCLLEREVLQRRDRSGPGLLSRGISCHLILPPSNRP
jgi:hypothetical protein